MKRFAYNFYEKVLVRTTNFNLDKNILEFSKNTFQIDLHKYKDALYISSKELFEKVENFKTLSEKDKNSVLLSLYKYYSRMCTRPTPFGLSAGVYLTKWGNTSKLKLNKDFYAFVYPDGALIQELYNCLLSDAKVIDDIYLHINDTYTFHSEKISLLKKENIKYSETSYIYKEFSAKTDESLSGILKYINKGKSFKEVISFLEENDIDQNEARNFISLLINQDILNTNLEPFPNSFLYLEYICNLLRQCDSILIKRINNLLKEINIVNTNGNISIDSIKSLEDKAVKAIPVLEGKTNLFRIDLNNSRTKEIVPNHYKKNIYDAYKILSKINHQSINQNLESFKGNFSKKYGEKFISILDIFNPTTGIPYIWI